jgi:hypothetical protein
MTLSTLKETYLALHHQYAENKTKKYLYNSTVHQETKRASINFHRRNAWSTPQFNLCCVFNTIADTTRIRLGNCLYLSL